EREDAAVGDRRHLDVAPRRDLAARGERQIEDHLRRRAQHLLDRDLRIAHARRGEDVLGADDRQQLVDPAARPGGDEVAEPAGFGDGGRGGGGGPPRVGGPRRGGGGGGFGGPRAPPPRGGGPPRRPPGAPLCGGAGGGPRPRGSPRGFPAAP